MSPSCCAGVKIDK